MPQMINSTEGSEKNQGGDFSFLQGEGRWDNIFFKLNKIFFSSVRFYKTLQGRPFRSLMKEKECALAGVGGEHDLLPWGGLLAASRFNQLSAGHLRSGTLQSRGSLIYVSQGCHFLGVSAVFPG